MLGYSWGGGGSEAASARSPAVASTTHASSSDREGHSPSDVTHLSYQLWLKQRRPNMKRLFNCINAAEAKTEASAEINPHRGSKASPAASNARFTEAELFCACALQPSPSSLSSWVKNV
ncbi:hypothetical protein NDU88_011531 [Pleurodeles waltl]|uniref:Uncharacterized protein n=1 Tax=Pleurodeles waltl TaxID=8319 RepID=A0AAV7Q1Y4_PLEWA|nr:hypothetical protein NDU88_011531 [Pleurodeles waltl]